jgi:hypothetical protein
MRAPFRLLQSSLACAALFMIAVSAYASSLSGPVVVLPNSYYLQPDDGGQTKLVKRDGKRVVPGTIAAYLVSGQLVVGAIGTTPPPGHQFTNDLEFTGTADTRYFILDTATGKLDSGLDEAAWHKRLQELGQRADLHIFPPLPWQS